MEDLRFSNLSLVDQDNILFRVYIEKVPPEFNQVKLMQLFSDYGDPFKVYIDKVSRWAVIYFGSYEDAKHCIIAINDMPPHRLVVRFATPPVYEMTPDEMAKMHEKLQRETERLLLEETKIRLKREKLESQKIALKRGKETNRKKDFDGSKSINSTFLEESSSETDTFSDAFTKDYNPDHFLSDIKGDIRMSQYENSAYKDFCEMYLCSWIQRFMPKDSYEKKIVHNQSYNKKIIQSRGRSASRKSCSNSNQDARSKSMTRGHSQSHENMCLQKNTESTKLDEVLNKKKEFNQHSRISRPNSSVNKNQNVRKSTENLKYDQDTRNTKSKFNNQNYKKVGKSTDYGNHDKKNNKWKQKDHKDTNQQNHDFKICDDRMEVCHSITKNVDKEDANKVSLTMSNVDTKSNYSTVELPKKTFSKVNVSWAESECEGWVLPLLSSDTMETLTLTLNSQQRKVISKPTVGMICSALYDDVWCRALILKTSPSVVVQFIDYGNTEIVKSTELYTLDTKLQSIPGQVMHIRLADGSNTKLVNDKCISVMPVSKEGEITICHVPDGFYHTKKEIIKSSPSLQNNTSECNIRCVTEMIQPGYTGLITFEAEFKSRECTATIYPLDLLEMAEKLQVISERYKIKPQNNYETSIGDFVMVHQEDTWLRGYVLEQLSNKNAWKVALIDNGTYETVTDIQKILPEDLIVPEFACYVKIIDIFDENAFKKMFKPGHDVSFNASKVEKDHIKCMLMLEESKEPFCQAELTRWEYKKDKIFTPVKKLKELSLNSGSYVKIIVAINQQSLLIQNREAARITKELVTSLESQEKNLKPLTRQPVVGEILAARYSKDNMWYRARIDSLKSDSVLIYFIDYGNKETIPVKNLRFLTKELLDIPLCLISIKLKGLPDKPCTKRQITELMNVIEGGDVFKLDFNTSVNEGVTLFTLEHENFNEKMFNLTKPSEIKPEKSDSEIQISEIKMKSPSPSPVNSENGVPECNLQIPSFDCPLGPAEVIFVDFFSIESGIIVCILHDQIIIEYVSEIEIKINKCINAKEPDSFVPKVCDNCLAKYEGTWYRALCLDVDISKNEAQVLYMDYGNIEIVPLTDIGKITKELIEEPSVTMICHILGNDNSISENKQRILKESFEKNHIYKCTILSKMMPGEYRIEMAHLK